MRWSSLPCFVLTAAATAVLPNNLSGQERHASKPMPEPMVFDLVRPLGAERGELEMNVLGQRTAVRGAPVDWAPEIEWAFADGLAFELELPMQNARVEAYKVALQGTFGGAEHAYDRFVHGWQVIGERLRADQLWSSDALYLAGFRVSPRVILFTMSGAGFRQGGNASWQVQPLHNGSVFVEASEHLTLGVETNFALGPQLLRSRLVMPQAHLELGRGYTLNLGVGAEQFAGGPWKTAFGARFVRRLR